MAGPQRRDILKFGALLLASPALSRAGSMAGRAEAVRLISAASDAEGGHWVLAAELREGRVRELFRQALPGRGHHVAAAPRHGVYLSVARRPGNWLVLGDAGTGEVLQRIAAPEGRHFYGHGVFSADESRFYTTENDYRDQQGDSGLVVEWALESVNGRPSLTRLREFSTAGVGPHELLLMPDGATLAVANGGMRTHPDSEREVLNADTMQPSLVYLDRSSGEVLEQRFLPAELHQASIRHMDVNAGGMVAFGMQFQGEPFRDIPLLATHRRGEDFRLLSAPPEIQPRLKQYVGSVRFSADGRYFAASSPRGSLLSFWNAHDGSFVRELRSRDACGLQAAEHGFVYSTGTGKVQHFDPHSGEQRDYELPDALQVFWDNHLCLIDGGTPA